MKVIIQKIEAALSVTGMGHFSVTLQEYSPDTFGNYSAELTDGISKLQLTCDRGQVFLHIWSSELERYVSCTDIYPEISKVYTANLNEVGIGVWTIQDLLTEYMNQNQRSK